MAIDESLLGGVRPSESAVDRLRKRNRIRPWEGGLVGAQPKQQSDVAVTEDRPPGQGTQGVNQPEGETLDAISNHERRSRGGSTSGCSTHGANRPQGLIPSHEETRYPEGKLPSGSRAPLVANPVGKSHFQAEADADHSTSTLPRSSDTLRVEHPVGKSPTGHQALVEKPSGSNSQGVTRPQGNAPVGVSPPFEIPHSQAPRVKDPGGGSPSGQFSDETRIPISGFDPTPFVPTEKGIITWREKGSGELRIPHRLYEYAHRVTSTRNELLVFDCLLRFSLGFHRSWCEAGYSFIAAWTGINDITNIKKSLRTLLGAGIVVKTKDHDSASNSGSIYEVPVVKAYLEYVASKKSALSSEQPAKSPLGGLPSGQANQRGITPGAGGQTTSGPVGELPPKKENSNKTPKKTLSQEAATELDDYIDQIKPASKRESEIFFLGRLLPEYPSQDVAMALGYVRAFGVLGSKQECHSPLKYLASAIEQVLPKAREYRELLQRSSDAPNKTRSAPNESETAEDHFRSTALAAFESEVPQEEQDRYLANVTRENSVMGYAPPISVLRGMAALKWFEERSTGTGKNCA